MKTLKLDDSWDLEISPKGYLEWIEPPEKFKQDLNIILKTIKGENTFQEDMGVNWFQIFDYPSENNVRDGITNALKQYYKPIVINNLDVEEDEETRTFKIDLDITIEDVREEISFRIGG